MFHIFQAEFFLYGEIFGLLLQDSKNYKFSQEKYTLQVVVFFFAKPAKGSKRNVFV